jgi:hypothetical protein
VGYASAGFEYDRKGAEYHVSLNGRTARAEEWSGGQRAATVVIQYVKQTKSQFWDKGGGNTPRAETIGTGTAMVLRDGRVWKTTWTRPNAGSGTTFTLAMARCCRSSRASWVRPAGQETAGDDHPLTKPGCPSPKPEPSATATPALPPSTAPPPRPRPPPADASAAASSEAAS